MIQPRSLSLGVVAFLAFSGLSRGEACRFGLYGSSQDACLTVQGEALEKVGSAKTICYSANSEVQWNKNSKQPVGAFATMRVGARMAMRGFTPLYSCERADLVVRIDYDDMIGTVKLNVIHADSGKSVFLEERDVSDLSSDVSRMAAHFQAMVSEARAAAKAEIEQTEARAKEKSLLTSLPKHWRRSTKCSSETAPSCTQSAAVVLSVVEDVLHASYEADDVLGEPSIKNRVSCSIERGRNETTPWTGECTYGFYWDNEISPTCIAKTTEVVTSISRKEITGRSQRVDLAPLLQNPPECPVPSTETDEFSLTPEKEK
jgi:hypothetical protein